MKDLSKLTLNQARQYIEHADEKYDEKEFNLILENIANKMNSDEYNTLVLESTKQDIQKATRYLINTYEHIIKFVCCQNTDQLSNWINTIYTQSTELNKIMSKNIFNNLNNNIDDIITISKDNASKSFKKYGENIAIKNVKNLKITDEMKDINNFILYSDTYCNYLLNNIKPEFKNNAEKVIKHYFR